MGNFNLNKAIDNWEKRNCATDAFTPDNIAEMRDHMYSIVEELVKENNLTEEEAFAVAKLRLGCADDWEEEMKDMNKDNFQLRKVVFVFGSILIYFIIHQLVITLSELLYIWLDYYNDAPAELNIQRVKQFVTGSYFVVIVAIVALYFMHDNVTNFLEQYRFTPLKIVFALLFLLILFFVGRYLNFEVKMKMVDPRAFGAFFKTFTHLGYILPTIFSAGFLILFLRYRNTFYIT